MPVVSHQLLAPPLMTSPGTTMDFPISVHLKVILLFDKKKQTGDL